MNTQPPDIQPVPDTSKLMSVMLDEGSVFRAICR